MKYLTLSCCLVLLSSLASAQPPDLKGKTLAETFAELLPKLEKDNAAQQQWQGICFRLGAPGNEKLRAEACTLMCAKLDAKTPTGTRLWLLTQLEHIGGEESVEPLAGLLNDKDDVVREAAVRALANNPSKEATGKLTAALDKAEGKAKIGLINALGHRADPTAVKDVAKELTSADEATAIAAARALGRIPGIESLQAVKAARTSAKGNVRKAVDNSMLVHADRLLAKSGKDGPRQLAAEIYVELNSPDEPRAIRLAALQGVIQTSGNKAGELILKILSGSDASEKAVALGQIEHLSADSLKTLAASLDKLPVPSQVAVITAIAARGDRSQLPVALAAAKNENADIRRAGILALGRLGDASVVEFLLGVMTGKDPLAGIAAESLADLPAEGVNEKLIAVLEGEKTAARAVALIGILERRRAVAALPALLKGAAGSDAQIRTAAFSSLKTLAGPDHVSGMIAALLKTEKGKEREQAELAVTAVAQQIPDREKRSAAVLNAIKTDPNRTADLLPLLGRLGGTEALKVIRESLNSTMLHDAAITGLCNWPDASANNDLLALAEKGKTDAEKLRALQALIRVNTVLIDRTPEERLATLKIMTRAMELATRDDERRAILEGLGNVRHIETLHYILPYLDQPALAQAACKGIVELAHSRMLREPNRAEFAKALDRVIALCKDKALVDRAKQYKASP
jgi:HEAT repeat protein